MPPVSSPAVLAPELTVTAPALVTADWLAEHLGDVRVVDTRRSTDHLDGHIPGAASFALDALLVEDTSEAALQRLAGSAQSALALRGIRPTDHVVLVDDADGSAALGALVCRLAGAQRVSILSAGISGWVRRGHAVEHVPAAAESCAEAWAGIEPGLSEVATIEQLQEAVATGSARIVDARSQLEHEGIVGAPCCAARGAIEDSIHLEWTALFDMAGQPHAPERVRAIAEHVGIHPDDDVIVTCHAGHRAAVAAHVLRSAGFEHVRVSLGSWHEWAARGLA
jgi:thiosulfate/3-mercaptopyruvate sulfurtransferase